MDNNESPVKTDEIECKAYKPWIHTNSVCETCPHNGKCEWTWPGPDEQE